MTTIKRQSRILSFMTWASFSGPASYGSLRPRSKAFARWFNGGQKHEVPLKALSSLHSASSPQIVLEAIPLMSRLHLWPLRNVGPWGQIASRGQSPND